MRVPRLITAAIATLLILFSASPFAMAQASGSGLSISPTLTQLTLKPGESKNITLLIKNATVGSINAVPTVVDFAADGVTGNPKLLTKPGESSPNSIKNFVYKLDKVPLDPGVKKDVAVGIHIPDGTPPGAYYGVLSYKAVPINGVNPSPGQVGLTASVGTIVLITVPGKVREQVQFNGIHIYRGATDGSIFVKPPGKIGIEVRNLGNGFIQPFGTVEVRDMFKKDVASFQFNNPKQLGNVLPESTRIFTNTFSGVSKPGRYTVVASVSYGNGGQILVLQKTFWYIPLWLAVLILLIIAALAYLVFRTYRSYQKEKRHSVRRD